LTVIFTVFLEKVWYRTPQRVEYSLLEIEKNVPISPREVSLLGMKFIVSLAVAHQRRTPDITAQMQSHGGYICHLDATCEGRDPLLMSSIDSLSQIVLGNVKLPAEDEEHIVLFLERIKKNFGIPLALVHDMGKAILAAVVKVFPGVADFICHFHFLRDIGNDFLGGELGARLCPETGAQGDFVQQPPIRFATTITLSSCANPIPTHASINLSSFWSREPISVPGRCV
jgi:hypothetical protein